MLSPAAPVNGGRYTAVAIVLHWTIATAVLANLLLGWWMQDALEAVHTQGRAVAAFQLHKSLGLTILVLSLLRLMWRGRHAPPPLPAAMPAWQRVAARATHWAFYTLMIGLPLSGWLYVSAQWRGSAPLNIPTLWFGVFEIPHLFGLNEALPQQRQSWAGTSLRAHEWLVWSTLALLALHVGAALKHHVRDRDDVLAQMLPGLKAPHETASPPRDPWRTAILSGGFIATAVAAVALALILFRTPLAIDTVALPSSAIDDHVIDAAPSRDATTNNTEDRSTAMAGVWKFGATNGEIAFSGVHAGVPFRGHFTRWQAEMRFDPADLAQSRITATIETDSATDGVPLHDQTLPQREWFDVTRHPHAMFRSTQIVPRADHRYDVAGLLIIKGRPLTLAPLTLRFDDARARITGRLEIDRSAADLGMESDPDAQYVSHRIKVELQVAAQRAQ